MWLYRLFIANNVEHFVRYIETSLVSLESNYTQRNRIGNKESVWGWKFILKHTQTHPHNPTHNTHAHKESSRSALSVSLQFIWIGV